jgi:flagellar basal body-associated protein FliL
MPDPQVSPAPRNRRKLGMLAVVLAVVLGAGGIFFWLRPEHSTSAAETSSVQSTLALETFVVNLSGSGERGYLRAGISLGLSHPLAARNQDEVPMALVRDTVLSVLSSARSEQLLQAEGKPQLKAELLRALQERVPQLGVQDVYFTEFLVQM